MPERCTAGRTNNYRITEREVTGGRVLVCAVCSASFPWGGPEGVGDGLPYHDKAEENLSRDQIIQAYKEGTRK